MKPSDLVVCARYEIRRAAGRGVRRLTGRPLVAPLSCRVSSGRVKRLILRNGLAVKDGSPWWFYSALDRGDADPLTNYSLSHLIDRRARTDQVLVTGCGTGITAFHLADAGFESVTGIDLLPECIAVADEVKRLGGYDGVHFAVDDAFHPSLPGQFDVITALHWVFSAWMGNYGNLQAGEDRSAEPSFREERLSELLREYAPRLRRGGQFLVELTDAVTDYRLAGDHPLGEASARIYPIRHTPEQVEACAVAEGLTVVDKKLVVSYGHHPRTLYILEKN